MWARQPAANTTCILSTLDRELLKRSSSRNDNVCLHGPQTSGIVGSTTGSNYYVRILSTLNRELLKPSSSVALHRHSNSLVDILPPEADSSISLLSQSDRPDVTYQV